MKKILFLLVLIVFVTTISYSEEIVRKSNQVSNLENVVEYIFFKGDKEIARQEVLLDREGRRVIKGTGKIPDGIVKQYYESGKLLYDTNYKDNREEGVERKYYENGNLQSKWLYKK